MKLYLYITNTEDYLEGNHRFRAADEKIEVEEWVFAGSIDFTPSVDDQEIRDAALSGLNGLEKEIRAEFESRLMSIESRKQKLLSITHQPLEVA